MHFAAVLKESLFIHKYDPELRSFQLLTQNLPVKTLMLFFSVEQLSRRIYDLETHRH